jgi:calcium-translocating P-type ATPase
VLKEPRRGHRRRARIRVHGLDREPQLQRRVVDRLQSHPDVHARANPLTGRVLVEFDEDRTHLDDLLAEVMDVELPPLQGEDEPAHPLDPAPLVQSITRTVGTALGLGFLVFRQLAGARGRPRGAKAAATTAGVIGLLRSFPFIRNGLRSVFGLNAADLVFSSASIVTLALAASPLGLAVVGTEAVLLLREVTARRTAWRLYEERLGDAAGVEPGAVLRLESGERAPRQATVIEGTGTATGRHGLPARVAPGVLVSAGARLWGGPFVVQLQAGKSFLPEPRPAPLAPTLYTHYVHWLGPISLGYAALTAILTRSLARTFKALLLVNPRTAIIGMEAASLDATSRVLRAGVTVVGTRRGRVIRRPDVLLLDGPRVLTDGMEIANVQPLDRMREPSEILSLAGGVAAAAGSPWGTPFRRASNAPAGDGSFDGVTASAMVDGVRYWLGPSEDAAILPATSGPLPRECLLVLRSEREPRPLGTVLLRPRLSPPLADLVQTCRQHRVRLEMIPYGPTDAVQALARRADVPLAASTNLVELIRQEQADGALVALASDSAAADEAFAACDLAIGLTSGRTGRFPARADVLATDLGGVASIVEAGARRDQGVRDAVGLSAAANVFGAVWGFRDNPGVEQASHAVYITALFALADAWIRLRGGSRPRSALAYLADPHPERWGRRSRASILRALNTTEAGLSNAEAARRRRATPFAARRHELLAAILEQLRSPVTAILGGGAFLALLAGQTLDIVIIGATITVNVAIGAWQEHEAGRAAEALQRLSTVNARVLRDGAAVTLPATAIVPGDILVLAPGDRVAADARVLSAHNLEVDEAALTGESLPVAKNASDGTVESRVIMEGSDIVVGSGRAVVVAVGRQTRLGATAAALALVDTEQSPLGARLARMLGLALPIAAVGGAVVAGAGFLWGHGWMPQLSAGVTVALAVVPESLPLLAGTGQVGVARRLVRHQALLRRLAAVEALGRVDVACTDKTGTMTEGKLALVLVSDSEREARLPGALDSGLRRVLLTAALASPHPDAAGAAAHPTDRAVLRGAQAAGLDNELDGQRRAEVPFDPARSFHATVVEDRLCVKGAPEELTPRCQHLRRDGREEPLNEAGRQHLLARAQGYAERGLRVLMVAEGSPNTAPDDPQCLTALGFIGIRDPLRPAVSGAVQRCREAGVRVLMITGDHPATARAVAREAGVLDRDEDLLTGDEIAERDNGELDRRLEHATVVARATPLDKLRIIESLQRLGHAVAMTGDGVNDAPALRLADVGVAMGQSGTEVARQAADVVLADDDFSTLVEALIEGRGFWRNMRRSLSLLLGGNLGELGLLVGTTVLGYPSPLNTSQILVVNLITDALPALSVALQRPEHHHLARLAREGTSALDAALRRDVFRRGVATSLPALTAYLLTRRLADSGQAGSVAFGTIVATQLSQTLDAGWAEGNLSQSVLGAVAASAGLLVSAMTLQPLRNLLRLTLPGLVGWTLMGAGSLAAVVLNRAFAPITPSRPLVRYYPDQPAK